MEYKAFVLSKDEGPNIRRSIDSLVSVGLNVTVLDSGSTDNTLEIVQSLGVDSTFYDYNSHCRAYNDITGNEIKNVGCVVLDADMRISPELWENAREKLQAGYEVIAAPVKMYCSGKKLRYASLCPPKPFLFRGGKEYFLPSGHGERLKDNCKTAQVEGDLIHDDRKPFEIRLARQQKYARQLACRARDGSVRRLDRVRLLTPATTMLVGPYILLGRLGFLDGFAGLQYAIERTISEAIFWRQGVREYLVKSGQ